MEEVVTQRTKDLCYYYAITQLPEVRDLRLDGARVDLHGSFQSALGGEKAYRPRGEAERVWTV